MDILDELTDKYSVEFDSELCSNNDYQRSISELHEFSEGLTEGSADKVEIITESLTTAAFHAGIKAGMRLGARIAVGLIVEDK